MFDHLPPSGLTPIRSLALLLGLAAASAAGAAAPLTVVGTTPTARQVTAPTGGAIAVTFDRAVTAESVTAASFHAMGRWSGPAMGAISLSPDGRTITLTPTRPFSAGETAMVVLSHAITAEDDGGALEGGYSFQFWTRAQPASMVFAEIDEMTTRTTPSESTRSYGGIASDLDGDGFLDITVVNEDTADLRVFLNKAQGDGLFQDFLEPPSPVGDRASPSEPADFNRDGIVDICVANIDDDTVSVLLGVGDGTFHPQQTIPVGDGPRGIAVLDVDADGDVDIVNTNSNMGGNLSLMLNDGTGVFGAPTFFEGASNGEWALGAADMNEDGHLDLVVGARFGQEVNVFTSNADGTFTLASERSGVGSIWMLNCGDVNGDGHEDVATANSSNDTGAILLGDGKGGLSAAVTYPTDPFPLATDLADLDGDGDLDWVTSSFQGDWFVFVNDGAGNFTFDQELAAPVASSCSLPLDIDNDGDLDLALIDELADVVIIMENTGSPCPADLDASGAVDFPDLLAVLAAWGPCNAPCPPDLDESGAVDFPDLLTVLAAWGPCR